MKLSEFVKLMTGNFDNKEQFEAMKNAGKAYPYAQHVNTICNDNINWRDALHGCTCSLQLSL